MSVPLFINGRFLAQPLSGVQRFAREVTAALIARDPAVEILVPRGTVLPADAGGLSDWLRPVGRGRGHAWEQLELPARARGGVLLNLGNTAPLRLRRQIVVIHDCGWASVPDAYSLSFRLAYHLLQHRLVRGGARIATPSAFAREEVGRHLGVAADRITLVPEGGEHMVRLRPDPSVLSAHGLQAGRYVLAVGNMVAHKNLGALSELPAALAARGLRLAIAGGVPPNVFSTENGRPVRAQAACYLGRVSDAALRALYDHAACMVFPSRYEGFGLPPLEAMVCGCPVAASGIPVVREVCGDAALYFDPADPADIAAAVCRIVESPALADQLRAKGAGQAKAFTWTRCAGHLLDLAHEVGGDEVSASGLYEERAA